jgi:isoleucyl-tRNA synthetase
MKNELFQLEKRILRFWEGAKIFEKSIENRKDKPDFVFYEGPPTANAKPGVHHVLARVFKDIICRYKTMRGFRVLRRAGWDTHGLPVELEIEKKLGLKNKKDIEKYGVAKFNKLCQNSVWQYKKDWENLTERIGFWLDLKNPYITYTPEYIETVWFLLKKIWEKGLLYEDFKVVPWCPRCGTALSSHEVAQGYKKIKEPAIFVKFQIKSSKSQASSSKIFLLVWTTTPWTLPGNVAVALNPEFKYLKVKVGDDFLILAKERMEACGIEGEIVEEFKGKDLIGLEYQPLYPGSDIGHPKSNIYKVVGADFVSLEEGTGLVHMAPAFGQEDLEVGRENNLPIIVNVTEEGRFRKEVRLWAGEMVTDRALNEKIIQDLEKRNLLFKREVYEHDYPFCWRCHSKLIYYAKKSWFIKMQAVKEELLENNKKINWIPSHLKEGRFGEWLSDLKDWALSRERFWGTPLPVWQCQKLGQGKREKRSEVCNNIVIIGSREDLLKQKFSTNQYFVLRHGEAENNIKERFSSYPEKEPCPLTNLGREQVEKVAEKLKKDKIDLIFSSDLLRCREAAEILGRVLGIKPIYDKRLREIDTGELNGKDIVEGLKFFNPKGELNRFEVNLKKFDNPYPKGENFSQVRARMLDFIKEIDRTYQRKKILIISHECPIIMLESAMKGLTKEETARLKEISPIKLGSLRKMEFKLFPYNPSGELDFHRPYIDEVKFLCPQCQKKMERVPEVIDVWFDSGAMPFGQAHWPFAWPQSQISNLKSQSLRPPKLFPADYICEAVDQTRGWFYTLLAISTLLGFGPSYKNVISLGHVLDEKGEKMSKSKGNVVDPWQMIEKYGADTLRWYFYTINPPGNPKLFSEEDVKDRLKKFILTFWNCYSFFQTYSLKPKTLNLERKSSNLQSSSSKLDKWIISRLNGLILEVTGCLDAYDITNAARKIENFVVEELSQWYIRRSRPRFQNPKTEKELREASNTLGFVLLVLAKLTAPFIPFLSEKIYRDLQALNPSLEEVKSVHLEDWPKAKKELIDKSLEEKMRQAREIVSQALKARVEAGIKVRQPLASLKIKTKNLEFEADKELLDLIKEEVNVKEIIFDEKIKERVELNTEITPQLKQEGLKREIIRYIQDMRKRAGLKPEDKVLIFVKTQALKELFLREKEEIINKTKSKELVFGEFEGRKFIARRKVKIDGQELWLGLVTI